MLRGSSVTKKIITDHSDVSFLGSFLVGADYSSAIRTTFGNSNTHC